MRFYTLLLAGLFFFGLAPQLHAQGDTPARKSIDSLARKVDTLQGRQDALSKQVKGLDSATAAAIDSSFSRSLSIARLHPQELYNQKTSGLLSFLAYALLALFVFFSFYFFFTTAICRNDSYDPNWTLKDVRKRSFSYSRVQLFWWTLLVLFCYIWFYAKYNVLLPLNPTVVILLGSGLGVFIFGKNIDNSQVEKNKADGPTRHQDIYDSRGFLIDILSDDNGVSIHRLQAVAFNIVFGLGFIGAFFTNAATKAAYPFTDFEPWQFSLLGISAVGYLGVKANENSRTTLDNRKAMMRSNKESAEAPTNPPRT